MAARSTAPSRAPKTRYGVLVHWTVSPGEYGIVKCVQHLTALPPDVHVLHRAGAQSHCGSHVCRLPRCPGQETCVDVKSGCNVDSSGCPIHPTVEYNFNTHKLCPGAVQPNVGTYRERPGALAMIFFFTSAGLHGTRPAGRLGSVLPRGMPRRQLPLSCRLLGE